MWLLLLSSFVCNAQYAAEVAGSRPFNYYGNQPQVIYQPVYQPIQPQAPVYPVHRQTTCHSEIIGNEVITTCN